MMLFADMRIRDAGDEAIGESHKYIDLSPADGSSVRSHLLRSQSTILGLINLKLYPR